MANYTDLNLSKKQTGVLIVVLLSVFIIVLALAHHKLNKANKEGDEHSAKVARVYLTLLYMTLVIPLFILLGATLPFVIFLLPVAAFVYITYLAHHHLAVAKRSGNKKTLALARFYLALYYIVIIACIVYAVLSSPLINLFRNIL